MVHASGVPAGSPAAGLGVGGERVRKIEAGVAAAGLWQRTNGTARCGHGQAVPTSRPWAQRCTRASCGPGWPGKPGYPAMGSAASGELGADPARQGIEGLVGTGESAAAQRPP
jgi:hypothetical protein